MPATKLNIVELIARMPDVDPPPKPPEARKKQENGSDQKQSPKVETPPDPPPDPNRPGKFTGPAPDVAKAIFEEIIAGGSASFSELLQLVHAPGDPGFRNYKAGYVLHGLAIHLGQPGREKQRRLLSESLVAAMANSRSTGAKAFFIQELQMVGGKEAVPALGKQLLDAELNESATRALLTIRDDAAAQFRKALSKVEGRSRLNIEQALALLAAAK